MIGIDNLDISAHLNPPLTTIHLPTAQLGVAAAERILAQIKGKDLYWPTRIASCSRRTQVDGTFGPSEGLIGGWLAESICSTYHRTARSCTIG